MRIGEARFAKIFFTPVRTGFGTIVPPPLRDGFQHPEVEHVVEAEHGPVEGLQGIGNTSLPAYIFVLDVVEIRVVG